jgi:hypothetical protein
MTSTPDNAFIPLTGAAAFANQRPDFSVTVLAQAENAQPFRPLGQPLNAACAIAHDSGCEPRVTVQREGERVSSIRVQCACGQVIELACVYESSTGKS